MMIVLAVAAWVAFLGLGFAAWHTAPWGWFAYAAVLALIGMFFELVSIRSACERAEPVFKAVRRELSRLRRLQAAHSPRIGP